MSPGKWRSSTCRLWAQLEVIVVWLERRQGAQRRLTWEELLHVQSRVDGRLSVRLLDAIQGAHNFVQVLVAVLLALERLNEHGEYSEPVLVLARLGCRAEV